MLTRALQLLLFLLIAVSVSCSTSSNVTVEEEQSLHYSQRESEQRAPSQVRGRIVNDTGKDVELFISIRVLPYLEDGALFLIPGKKWRLGIDESLISIACLSPSEGIPISDLVDQYNLQPDKITSVLGAIESLPAGTACTPHPKPSTNKPRLLKLVCVEWQADDTDTFRIVKKWDCYWPSLVPEEEATEDETGDS